jgi:hypothetical protein
MASTYTPLGIEKMATGENAGTWGTKTNNNLDLISELTGGFAQVSIAGAAQTTALTVVDGATTGTAQRRFIEFTGTITGNQIVTIPNDVETFYILKNSTTGAFTVQFKYATGSGDTFTFSATNKKTAMVQASANDGTNPDIIEIQTGGDVVDDTSPQLGGNLDVNGNSIVSASGGNIAITPDTSGNIILDGLTFPNADGSADQVLKTNGSGTLSFTDVSGGTSWQAVKTTAFTAVAGEGYFINTTSGAITMTLPASPTIGDEVAFIDYAGTFDTNNLTVGRNSEKINGSAADLTVATERAANTLVYTDGTQGWLLKNN